MLKLHSLEPANDGTDRVIMDVEIVRRQTWWQRLWGLPPDRRNDCYIGSGGAWREFPDWPGAGYMRGSWVDRSDLYRLWRDHERGCDAA